MDQFDYELNHLAKRIADFDDYQKISFNAYMKAQDDVTVKQLINASCNLIKNFLFVQ